MKILAFDSSAQVATVAIAEDDKLIAEYTLNHKMTHSQTLMVMVDEIIKSTQTDIKTIDAIALSGGPGSFTGLRIGSASAKGLAYALDKPIVSVPTMDAYAYRMWGCSDYICPMMDARREQVFTGIYTFEKGELKTIMPQGVIALTEVMDKLNELVKSSKKQVMLLGDGAYTFKDKLAEGLVCDFYFAPVSNGLMSASAVAALAFEYIKNGKLENAENHAPHYYRLSQAEREKMERELTIEKLENDEDMEALSKIEAENFSMPWSKESFQELKSIDYTHYLVAKLNGEVIGGCGLWNAAGDGNITNVVVRKDKRGKGYATKMLEQLLSDGKAMGVNAFTLEVRVSNEPAIALYKKLGFVSEGIRPGFYDKPKEDAMILWKR